MEDERRKKRKRNGKVKGEKGRTFKLNKIPRKRHKIKGPHKSQSLNKTNEQYSLSVSILWVWVDIQDQKAGEERTRTEAEERTNEGKKERKNERKRAGKEWEREAQKTHLRTSLLSPCLGG